MIHEITTNMVSTFNNAISNVEEIVRELKKPQDYQPIKPFISMVTLGYLHRVMSENILSANSNKTRILIVKLFFRSFEPYLRILNKWLKHGTLQDKYLEFFIKARNPAKVITNFYSRIDWNDEFIVQSYHIKWKTLNEERTLVCIPSFLSKFAKNIMNIGKTIKVLGYLVHHEGIQLKFEKVFAKHICFIW